MDSKPCHDLRYPHFAGRTTSTNLETEQLRDWIHNLPWAKLIGEADCKEQLNKIHPMSIIQCMEEASQWLTKQRRWSADDQIWSIHRERPKLDRAGQASAKSFKHITHTFLTSIVGPPGAGLPSQWGRSGRALGASRWGAVFQPKLRIYIAFGA